MLQDEDLKLAQWQRTGLMTAAHVRVQEEQPVALIMHETTQDPELASLGHNGALTKACGEQNPWKGESLPMRTEGLEHLRFRGITTM